ncbi:hypothetical protein H7X65_03615 [Candidatus Parcubacteria bacterium]|nr:hypothetical protein [Candidatus Parcubacteria bacterium]
MIKIQPNFEGDDGSDADNIVYEDYLSPKALESTDITAEQENKLGIKDLEDAKEKLISRLIEFQEGDNQSDGVKEHIRKLQAEILLLSQQISEREKLSQIL